MGTRRSSPGATRRSSATPRTTSNGSCEPWPIRRCGAHVADVLGGALDRGSCTYYQPYEWPTRSTSHDVLGLRRLLSNPACGRAFMFQPAGVMIQIAVANCPERFRECSSSPSRVKREPAHTSSLCTSTANGLANITHSAAASSGNARCLGDLCARAPRSTTSISSGGWRNPPVPCTVRADDTVRAVWTVEEVRRARRAGRHCALSITVTNEHGDTVQDRYDVLMVNKRPIPTQLLLTHNTYGPRPVRGTHS
jgi:hypothetical protein